MVQRIREITVAYASNRVQIANYSSDTGITVYKNLTKTDALALATLIADYANALPDDALPPNVGTGPRDWQSIQFAPFDVDVELYHPADPMFGPAFVSIGKVEKPVPKEDTGWTDLMLRRKGPTHFRFIDMPRF